MPVKILFLSDVNSVHTRKWALALANQDFKIGLFSLNRNSSDWFKNNSNITFLSHDAGFEVVGKREASKIKYIRALPALKKAIRAFQPDILHAHYATSYGLLGALSGFHPFIISVWGSDVYEFPKKTILHRYLLERNLAKADCILSTSQSMAEETSKYTTQKIHVTPFGIDINVFKPQKVKSLFAEGDIVIGTIKALEASYGVDYLVEAFAILCSKHKELPLKLLIVGGGSQEKLLKELCIRKGIWDKVKFMGWINHEEIPQYHNMLGVYVALSNEESFGVAILEASACGKPVVVSDASGLAEVVENGKTGIVVPRKNPEAAAKAIEKIILDKQFASSLGAEGRKRVENLYNWRLNLNNIIEIYKLVLKQL